MRDEDAIERDTRLAGGSPMSHARLRFYAELNDFLTPPRRQVSFAAAFDGRVSIKDLIESLGVPHPEVALVLVNGAPVDFSYIVRDEDQISVYPPFSALDVSALTLVAPPPPRPARFVLDTHLGKLAGYLRMLGFDTLYRNDYPDDLLAQISSAEGRILLTRDRGLLKRGIVTHGYYLRATDPRLQIVEVLRRFDLFGQVVPFQRCLHCNGPLQPAAAEHVADQLPPAVRREHSVFRSCPACGRVYWRGSHFNRMQQFIADILAQGRPD